MYRPQSLIDSELLGSYLCSGWELRVTLRCLEDDLGHRKRDLKGELDFSAYRKAHPIVDGFVRERHNKSAGTDEVTPLTCGGRVSVLRQGEDHRGGTFHDVDNEIIWLVGAGRHRSGASDDFFPYIKGVDAAEGILPVEADFERAFIEEDQRFIQAITVEIPQLLEEARRSPCTEINAQLGDTIPISLVVDNRGETEETTVLLLMSAMQNEHWALVTPILALFHPDAEWTDANWIPNRAKRDDEIGFKHPG